MHGWLPITVQAVAAVVLALAIGWRSRRWRLLWLPLATTAGVATALVAYWYVRSNGLAGDPGPPTLWIWIGLTGSAVMLALLGWRGIRWWRRGASVLAVPLCLLSAILAVNRWVGYFPTARTAWSQLTARSLPDQTNAATVTVMQQKRIVPTNGTVVPVTISAAASGFSHRDELVYLPPAWYATYPPPRLPVVMMIGAEFNTPTDWLRAGNAVSTIDTFASAHGGNAPVLVFVDSSGAFDIDTECVNGRRGNAADHLTKDVVPFMISNFGASAKASNWGVAGFSAGGTCAFDLTVMHPDLFSTFVDIAGDLSPNAGTKVQTIARLFGGNADAWAAFDPTTVITKHGPYTAVSGWFAVTGPMDQHRSAAGAGSPGNENVAADSLCSVARKYGVNCVVIAQPGKHDWPFAAQVFTTALPWLAGQLGSPGGA